MLLNFNRGVSICRGVVQKQLYFMTSCPSQQLLQRQYLVSKKTGPTLIGQQRFINTLPPPTTKPGSTPMSPKKVIGFTFIGVLTASVLYKVYKQKKEQDLIDKVVKHQIANNSSAQDYLLSTKPPIFEPSRKIRNPNDKTGLKLTLFQYQTCPFCCKARAFLDYFGFNYDVIEVNSVMRTQVKWSNYKKVPFVVVETKDGTTYQLNDSSLIISVLKSLVNKPDDGLEKVLACYPKITSFTPSGSKITEIQNRYFLMFHDGAPPTNVKKISEERKWRIWVDEVLVHTLSPNVYRTMAEANEAFQWFDKAGEWEKHFAKWERFLVIYAGAFVMWIIGKRLKKRHNLPNDVRQALYNEINKWLKALKARDTPFMGGQEPDLADLAVYGVLSAIEGCSTFEDLIRETNISGWYYLMKQKCKDRAGEYQLQF